MTEPNVPPPQQQRIAGRRSASRLWAWIWLAVAAGAFAALAALIAAPSLNHEYLRIGHWSTDWRSALLSPRLSGPHEKIAFVSINDATLKDYVSSPIDRGLLARIVRAVDATGPRAIGVDVLFLKRTDAEKDEALVAALRDAKAPVILGAEDERGPLEKFQREFQSEFLARTGRSAGYVNLRRQNDDVVRFTAVPQPNGAFPKSFARLLAEAAGAANVSDDSRPITWMLGRDDDLKPFLVLPAQDLLADADLGNQLKGKVVVIGGDFPFRDRHRVPQTVRTGQQMPGAVIHGQVVAMMLDQPRAVHEMGALGSRILILVAALVGFGLGWRLGLSNLVTYLGWGFATALLVALDAAAFRGLGLLLPFTLMALAWVAGITAGRSLRTALQILRRARDADERGERPPAGGGAASAGDAVS